MMEHSGEVSSKARKEEQEPNGERLGHEGRSRPTANDAANWSDDGR